MNPTSKHYCFLTGALASLFATVGKAGTLAPIADTIFINGNLYTQATPPKAEAIAVKDGLIVAVGSNEQIEAHRGPTTNVVSLEGRTVLPGLIDAHGHMAGLGALRLGLLDLSSTKSFDEVIEAIQEAVGKAKPGEWIVGRGWDHESWEPKALPSHERLSRISPKNPVWLERVDGHAALANAEAMRLASVTEQTATPEGGDIARDPSGKPSGIFVDNAMSLVDKIFPGLSAGPEEQILKAQEQCLAVGLTGVHDAGITLPQIAAYRRLADDGRLKIRVYAMIAADHALEHYRHHESLAAQTEATPTGPAILGDRFTMRAVKLYADGAMGSRGAWLLEPYADRPTDDAGNPYTGFPITPLERLREVCTASAKAGFQVCIHAIGDRANREVLNCYEAVLGAKDGDFRWRIEHAQLLNPSDISRFAGQSVIPSMQPTHATSDMRWVEARVGSQRLAGAYAWRGLLQTGAHLAFGSDFPVESHNPFLGLYAAVTRQDLQGHPPGGWLPEQRLIHEEALLAFTLGAAYAAFEENKKGSLEPGKYADFIVVDRDVMTCEAKDIPGAQVLRTVIAGETVYSK